MTYKQSLRKVIAGANGEATPKATTKTWTGRTELASPPEPAELLGNDYDEIPKMGNLTKSTEEKLADAQSKIIHLTKIVEKTLAANDQAIQISNNLTEENKKLLEENEKLRKEINGFKALLDPKRVTHQTNL